MIRNKLTRVLTDDLSTSSSRIKNFIYSTITQKSILIRLCLRFYFYHAPRLQPQKGGIVSSLYQELTIAENLFVSSV